MGYEKVCKQNVQTISTTMVKYKSLSNRRHVQMKSDRVICKFAPFSCYQENMFLLLLWIITAELLWYKNHTSVVSLGTSFIQNCGRFSHNIIQYHLVSRMLTVSVNIYIL